MRLLPYGCGLLLFGQALSAQAPLKTIDDGALDSIQLFVTALEHGPSLTVVMKPFDATAADLGTGGKGGKDARSRSTQAAAQSATSLDSVRVSLQSRSLAP